MKELSDRDALRSELIIQMAGEIKRLREERRCFVVCQRDYGDNGWGIEAIFDARDAAEAYIEANPLGSNFYYEIEEYPLLDGWTDEQRAMSDELNAFAREIGVIE
jgi:hypothetical protein